MRCHLLGPRLLTGDFLKHESFDVDVVRQTTERYGDVYLSKCLTTPPPSPPQNNGSPTVLLVHQDEVEEVLHGELVGRSVGGGQRIRLKEHSQRHTLPCIAHVVFDAMAGKSHIIIHI